MLQFKESQVCLLLKKCPDKKTSELSKDIALVKSLSKVFNATLDIANNQPKNGTSLAVAVAKKGIALSGVEATASESNELKMANFAATQILKTIGLTKIAGLTPAKASIYLTFTMAEKVVSAAGLANVDKCKLAIASLATTSGMGALICFSSGAFTLGGSCVAGVISIAFDAFEVYGSCHAQRSNSSANSFLQSTGSVLP